jgi:hypothetical protein
LRTTSRLLVLALSSWLLTGCSWLFMSKPPANVSTPNYPIDCSTTIAPPVLDSLCAGYFVLNGVVLAGLKDCASASYGESCAASNTKTGGILLSAGLAVLCGVSAGAGFGDASRCQSLKEQNALCMSGVTSACQKLNQGWAPHPLPTPQGPPPPAWSPPEPPLPAPDPARGCAKDTDCKGDRVCNKGECTEPRPPLPEPKL